jgi:secreted trypsin-like serine protease
MAFRVLPIAATLLLLVALVTTPASAIVGGQPADEGEYPWQAAITSGSGSSQYCGGTLVDSTTVVTAAHCMGGLLGVPVLDDLLSLVLSSPVHVLLGTNHLSSGGESIEATEIFVHPEYDGDHDVAILKLATPSTLASRSPTRIQATKASTPPAPSPPSPAGVPPRTAAPAPTSCAKSRSPSSPMLSAPATMAPAPTARRRSAPATRRAARTPARATPAARSSCPTAPAGFSWAS